MIKNLLVMPLCSDGITPAEVLRCVESIVNQEYQPFPFFVQIMVNTNSDAYFESIRLLGYPCVWSESNGGNGKGHNSVLEYFRLNYAEEWSHLTMIDADDYLYPSAFEALDDIANLIEFDYLSNMQITDSVRTHETQQTHLPVIPGVWLHSNFNRRYPIPDYRYYDGYNCSGGEVTLCISAKAVECDLKHMEIPMIPDDFTHMLWALKAHVEGKLLFVNTDTNDFYIYDKSRDSSTTNQREFVFDPDMWPVVERDLLRGPTFRCLLGLSRQQLPWVTIPQIMMPDDKLAFIEGKMASVST